MFERKTNMRVTYKNKDKVLFDIDVQSARVPTEANYWGYHIKATERGTSLGHVYFAAIKKTEVCDTQDKADSFIIGRPIEYLKSSLLDRYENGTHLLIWPELSNSWMVI
jgi:hypothetical protein